MSLSLVVRLSVSEPVKFGLFETRDHLHLYETLLDIGVQPEQVLFCSVNPGALVSFIENHLEISKLDYQIKNYKQLFAASPELDLSLSQAFDKWNDIEIGDLVFGWLTFHNEKHSILAHNSGQIIYLLHEYWNLVKKIKLPMNDYWFSVALNGLPPLDVPVFVATSANNVNPCAVELTRADCYGGMCWMYPIGDFPIIMLHHVLYYKFMIAPNETLCRSL